MQRKPVTETLLRVLEILLESPEQCLESERLYHKLYPGRVPRCGGRGAAHGGPSGEQTAINFLLGRKPYRDWVEWVIGEHPAHYRIRRTRLEEAQEVVRRIRA